MVIALPIHTLKVGEPNMKCVCTKNKRLSAPVSSTPSESQSQSLRVEHRGGPRKPRLRLLLDCWPQGVLDGRITPVLVVGVSDVQTETGPIVQLFSLYKALGGTGYCQKTANEYSKGPTALNLIIQI